MKKTGIVRHVDELGRIVLPIELRRVLEMEVGDTVEFFVNDANEQILFRKYRTQECIFCSSIEQLVYFRERLLCQVCLKELAGNDKQYWKLNRKRKPRNLDTKLRLAVVMEQYPTATQKEWASMIGVSQGWVSQLLKG